MLAAALARLAASEDVTFAVGCVMTLTGAVMTLGGDAANPVGSTGVEPGTELTGHGVLNTHMRRDLRAGLCCCGWAVRTPGSGGVVATAHGYGSMVTASPHKRGGHDGGAPPPEPPHRVRLPVNIHYWDNVSLLHWPFPPDDIARHLPEETTVLTFDEMAWVTVTPFFIRVRPPGVPWVPRPCAFPETNLRTYVAGPDGRQGLWFLRMEVSALWFVAVLRALGLPYFRHRMSVDIDEERAVYRSWPRMLSSGGGHHIVVCLGEDLDPVQGGPWDRFVTARWGAFHRRGPLLLYTPVEHGPWPLRAAEVPVCSVDALFRDAGLPAPAGPPVAHFSPGVRVKVGVPQLVGRATTRGGNSY